MKDQILLKVTVITDDETGIYQTGELDFSIPSNTDNWLQEPVNRKKLADWLQWLSNQCRKSLPPFEPKMTEQELEDFVQQLQAAKI